MSEHLPDHLVTGYKTFLEKRLPGERDRFRQLAEAGQKPPTMVIACCDSRTAPETIFSSSPGEIFVVRNVANLVPPYEPGGDNHSVSAALEFAVQALKVKHIVILGHSHCGGIKAALSPEREPLSPGDFIGKWVGLLDPVAKGMHDDDRMTPEERQTATERTAIRHSVGNLRTFPMIEELEAANELTLHGAWVDIATGDLWTMDPQTGEFGRMDSVLE
ncbi:putative carbonic anhydrase protein [Fulvimarina pelagi HTCC2506]|uniref:Carbonic anhydrase n=1 Tax=Fulvimarina pelagi HTCC2506 TaxID=314231 RepID=Q0G3L9_9HYPH|nr:carbonic anhydrase [Fulvimarina pelagi]EAU41812.1 putative carbonic anhydrase protein [Fulvimarina pelagi HTCC2506]